MQLAVYSNRTCLHVPKVIMAAQAAIASLRLFSPHMNAVRLCASA